MERKTDSTVNVCTTIIDTVKGRDTQEANEDKSDSCIDQFDILWVHSDTLSRFYRSERYTVKIL